MKNVCLMKKLSLVLISFASLSFNGLAQQNKNACVWGFTYLKATPNNQKKLREFLYKNWFAIDQIAVEKGLLKEYHLFENQEPDQVEWDILIVVKYKDEKGYDGIQTEFEEIRTLHKRVLIDGLGFSDLGKIISSKTLLENQNY
jgi:hypothetical protein